VADLRVCVVQPPSPAGSAERALATLREGLAVAQAAGAGVAVFPELLFPGYNAGRLADLAQPAGGEWETAARAMARDAGVACAFGYAERDGARLCNSATAIGADGSVLARYRKIQPYGAREAALFTPGDAYATFAIAGRKAALLICYDVEFAHHVGAVAAAGAEIVLVPTANMMPFTHVTRLTVPAQAVTQGVAIAYANYAGTEGDLDYCGGSLIVNADGAILAQAGLAPAVLVTDVPAPDRALLSTQARDFRKVSGGA